MYRDYIGFTFGIMEKKMETTIVYWGLYKDYGKENGNLAKCIQGAIIIIIVDVISIVAVEEGVGDDVEALGGHECHLRAMLGLGGPPKLSQN